MSTSQIAFIIENCHACKVTKLRLYTVLSWQLHEGDDWQEIELQHSIWDSIKARYAKAIEGKYTEIES